MVPDGRCRDLKRTGVTDLRSGDLPQLARNQPNKAVGCHAYTFYQFPLAPSPAEAYYGRSVGKPFKPTTMLPPLPLQSTPMRARHRKSLTKSMRLVNASFSVHLRFQKSRNSEVEYLLGSVDLMRRIRVDQFESEIHPLNLPSPTPNSAI